MDRPLPRAEQLIAAATKLSRQTESLSFGAPVTHIYNPLDYAAAAHAAYIRAFAAGPKRVLFWGMNPGPWGMAQTGVPFGEIDAVSRWMGIQAPVRPPEIQHPRRPIEGYGCRRSEVSGRRLWGLMESRFGTAHAFFSDQFVANYCPLVFMEGSGRNRTPDKLPADERRELFSVCDEHARRVISILKPQWIVGIGKFALGRLGSIVDQLPEVERHRINVVGILHPSPANPRANREWDRVVVQELERLGVW